MPHQHDPDPPPLEQEATSPTAPEYRSRAADQAAARSKIHYQQSWVEHQIRQAERRGDFDDLTGAGEPLPEDLSRGDDPDWWVRKLVEREQIAVLPPALAVRKEDAELDDRLDRIAAERDVRHEVEEFNARVRHARRQLQGGPPCITPERDVEAAVTAWRERRDARRAAQQQAAADEERRDRRRRRRRPWRRDR